MEALLLFTGVLSAAACCQNARTEINNSSAGDFQTFRKKFHRLREVSSEELLRLHHCCFQDATLRHVYLNSFSTAAQSARYGINQFSDLSQMEFRDIYLRAVGGRAPAFSGHTIKGLPAKFDWRDKGVVAPVQNQLACGSCWAFSVVGAVQSVGAIGGSQLEQLSVQQVVDCSYNNEGCNGGSPSQALSWLKQSKVKLVAQSEYPYKAETGICHFFPLTYDGVALKNYTVHNFRNLQKEWELPVPSKDKVQFHSVNKDRSKPTLTVLKTKLETSGDVAVLLSGQEEAMMGQLVQSGPLVVVVDAVSWQDYLGGIIQHHCSSRWSNHAVLVVGYDTTGEIPFWIVQNSWGTTWGNEGYVYVQIGANVCGISDSVAAVFL